MIGAFTWGQGGEAVPDAERVARQRRAAEILLANGASNEPIQHWTQGLGRASQMLLGAYLDRQATDGQRAISADAAKTFSGLFGGGEAAPAPAAATNGLTPPGNLNPPRVGEVSTAFLNTVKQGGVTNPNALAAIGATGERESGWKAANAARTWSDPSESGQAGTSGGALSWRGDRLARLQAFARANGEEGNGSAETQARFFMQEDPALVARLNAARTPQEAMTAMNEAWRFAGYNRPGGERDARLAAAQSWAAKMGQAPEVAADSAAAPMGRAPVVSGSGMAAPMGRAPVAVAQAGGGAAPSPDAPAPAAPAAPGVPSYASPMQRPEVQGAMKVLAHPGATPVQKQIAGAILQRAMTQEQKTPAQIEMEQLQLQNLRNQTGLAPLQRRGVEMDLAKKEREMAGFRAASAEEKRAMGYPETMPVQIGPDGRAYSDVQASKIAQGRDVKRTVQPVYGINEKGETVMLQPGDDGTAVQTQLPPGVKIASGVDKIDGGTNWILIDKRTGQVVGSQPKDLRGVEREKEIGTVEGKLTAAAPGVVTTADQTVKQIDDVLNHPNFRDATGMTGAIWRNIPSTPTYGLNQRIEQIKGRAFLEAFETLKGGGAITQVEGEKATAAIARLNAAQTEKDFRQSLMDLRDIVMAARERARARLPAQGQGGGAPPAPQPAAPSGGPRILSVEPVR